MIHTTAAAMPNSTSLISRRDSGLDCWAAEVRTNEVRRLSLQQLDGITGAMCRSIVLLEDKCVACYLFDDWNHPLRQQDTAIVLAINFNSGIDKHQLSHTHF